MIIDIHTHTYPEKIAGKAVELLVGRSGAKAHTDGTLGGLKLSTANAGIDISVVLPVVTSPKQTEHINDVAAAVSAQFNGRGIFSFGGIHPENDNYKEILNFVSREGLKGIKLHPDYQNVFFDDIKCKRIISYAIELGLAVVVHAGTDIGLPKVVHCTPDMVCNVLDDVKPDKLILAHMGGWNMWDEVYEKLCGRDVFFDTAFSVGDIDWVEGRTGDWRLLDPGKFVRLVKRHGAEHVLFGTDSPWADQEYSVRMIQNIGLTNDEKNMILGENAKKLLFFDDLGLQYI